LEGGIAGLAGHGPDKFNVGVTEVEGWSGSLSN
jgi:hypothetical protein